MLLEKQLKQGRQKRSSFGRTIVKKKFLNFVLLVFFFQVILYADILCCLFLDCNVQYIFHANSENVAKIA